MAGTFMLVMVGQSAGLMATGMQGALEKRTDGAKVGRPCSKRLFTNHKGLIRLVAITFALPV
jgi:hypothetical protein